MVPLGVTADDEGVNVALWADEAELVEVCLFDEDGTEQRSRSTSRPSTSGTATCPACARASATASACTVPGTPARGHRFNPAKLLADPYARAIDGRLTYDDRSSATSAADRRDARDDRDSRAVRAARRSSCATTSTGAATARRGPRWADTVVYEAHVRGLTARHPDVPEQLRGTYAGLAHPAVVEHLTRPRASPPSSCCPSTTSSPSRTWPGAGLVNYWGYNSLGYFAPHAGVLLDRRSRGEQVSEFKAMVKTLHAAGLEVILDVVYNHTAEGGAGRADAVASAGWATRPTTSSPLTAAAMPTTPAAATRSTCRHPARPAAGDGLAAVLGAGDARRRLPLRPGVGAGPVVCTTSTC